MSERMTMRDRAALVAGDRAGALEPDEAADAALLATLLADPATWAEPRAELEDAVVHAVLDDERSASNVTFIGAVPQGARRRRRFVIPGAAVAAVAAVVVGAIVSTSGSASPAFSANLAATAVAPNAHGTLGIVHNKGGFRITLDARGLEPLPEGEYYEAWLKNSTGTLVPIGTFSSTDEYISLWSGVSPARFTTFTVTIESADNNQASSGQVVLRGDLHPG